MATSGFQSTAQANPKATLGLVAAAGYLFLGGLKGALFGGGAGALLLGLTGLKKAFTFSGEGEDPRFQNVYDWKSQFGQDDGSDASYLDDGSDGSDGSGDGSIDALDASTWVQDDTTGQGDTSDQSAGYSPGAGGMVGTQDQFTSGPELISQQAEDEEGTGVWSTDDDIESEYSEGEGDNSDYATDGGGGGYDGGGSGGGGGGSSGGGSSGGGSYDTPPPNVPGPAGSIPLAGGAGGGPTTVSAPTPPPVIGTLTTPQGTQVPVVADGQTPPPGSLTQSQAARLSAIQDRIAKQQQLTQQAQAAAAAAAAAQQQQQQQQAAAKKPPPRMQQYGAARTAPTPTYTQLRGVGPAHVGAGQNVLSNVHFAPRVSAPNIPRGPRAPTSR